MLVVMTAVCDLAEVILRMTGPLLLLLLLFPIKAIHWRCVVAVLKQRVDLSLRCMASAGPLVRLLLM